MCDYCGCREHDAIAALSIEHETLLGMLTEMERHADNHSSADARPLLGRLHDLLSPHALREEHGVFTELEQAGVGHLYITMFEADHQQIHALLARTETANWEPAVRELVRTLRDHIAREESDLFPAAHQLLVPSQWDAVDQLTERST